MRTQSAAQRQPHDYQLRGVEWLLMHGGAGLFADPGCGKTAITMRAVQALKDSAVGHVTLVVAPLRVAHEVWPAEGAEWAGSDWDCLKDLQVVVLHGKYKEQLLEQPADIYVINIDGLKWLLQDGGWRLEKLGVDNLVIDESSKFKHTRTKRFKALKPWLGKFKRRWILTGSPNPNGYLDLFGQIYIIDLGRALGGFITHYRFTYFTPLDRNGWAWAIKKYLEVDAKTFSPVAFISGKVVTITGEEAIQRAIAPYIFRLDADDYMQLPKLVNNVIRVDLPEDARKVYDEIEEDLITYLVETERPVIAANKGAAHVKCAQIANGGLYHMPIVGDLTGTELEKPSAQLRKRTWTNLHDEKTNAVLDLLDELQGVPALITYEFEHDLDRLRKALGADAPYVGGGVNPKRTKELLAAWNASELPWLLVQPQTVSHGLNMQRGIGQHIILHSLIYDYDVYDQLIRRLRRQGSKVSRIFVHHIVARDTVDEAKLRSLRRKHTTQTNFLLALKEYARVRAANLKKIRRK